MHRSDKDSYNFLSACWTREFTSLTAFPSFEHSQKLVEVSVYIFTNVYKDRPSSCHLHRRCRWSLERLPALPLLQDGEGSCGEHEGAVRPFLAAALADLVTTGGPRWCSCRTPLQLPYMFTSYKLFEGWHAACSPVNCLACCGGLHVLPPCFVKFAGDVSWHRPCKLKLIHSHLLWCDEEQYGACRAVNWWSYSLLALHFAYSIQYLLNLNEQEYRSAIFR